MEALIDYGADLELADRQGHTPLLMAACFGDVDIIEVLIHPPTHLSSIHRSIHPPTHPSIHAFIDPSTHPSTHPSMHASTQVLLESGADVSKVDINGKSAAQILDEEFG